MAEHSIFGASPPSATWGWYSDGGADSIEGIQFYVDEPSTVVAIRIWADGDGIGKSGWIGTVVRTGQQWTYNTRPNGPDFGQTPIGPLVAGWNRFDIVPQALSPDDGLMVGLNLDGWYLYSSDLAATTIQATDGYGLFMSQMGSGDDPHRSYYSPNYAVNEDVPSAARWYGIDIIVDDGDTPVVPTGGFEGTYAWGPADAEGSRESAGGFAGSYAWGPATAEGSRESVGDFSGAYGWGAAEASGSSVPEGGFSGAYSWGPAGFTAEADAEGSFSGAYGWGPATFSGDAKASGGFAGSYGWGPAESGADTGAEGGFEGAFGWGPALAGGTSDPQGAFSGTILWGPAVAAGSTTHSGGFAGAYAWGPATAGGSFDPDFCWPPVLSLIPDYPGATLIASQTSLVLANATQALTVRAEQNSLVLLEGECP